MTTTIQAPSVNLVTANITTTAADATAAAALITIFIVRCGSRRTQLYFTRPAAAITNPVNTPIA